MGLSVDIEDLRVTYEGRGDAQSAGLVAIDGVSVKIRSGEIVAIVGPSGCGKTTVLNVLAGFLPFSGRVRLGDQPPGWRRDLGYMFQRDALLPWRTLRANVEFALEIRDVPPSERRTTAEAYLARLGLASFEGAFPYEVSGGMAKRASLAQALIHRPALLLLDEPFAALDAFTRAAVEQDLLQLLEQSKTTAVFVTHNLQEAIALSDRVVVMSARPGRVLGQFEIPLPRPRSVLDVQYSPGFSELESMIWSALRAEILGTNA